MDVNIKIKPNLRIRAFYLFFIIFGVQIGVGIIGAPRFIFQEAEQDAWIAILLSLIAMIIVVFVMFFILKQYQNADIFGIHVDIFGKWIGRLLGTIYIVYFAASLLSILLTYTEVIQLFLYPTIPNYLIAFLLLILGIYCVLGGIKAIVGAAFIFSILPLWIILVLFDPISRMDWDHLLPMFQASIPELLQGARATTYSVSGFEILFLIYPFIENKQKAKLPVILGLCATTFFILIATVISIGYFGASGLKRVDWSVLTLFKSASFTFIERLDYIVVVEWVMVLIPNIAILLWAITYGMKRLYKIPQRSTLYAVAVILLIIASIVKYDYHIVNFTDIVAQVGFWIIFVYPFILLPLVLIKKKWRNKKGSATK